MLRLSGLFEVKLDLCGAQDQEEPLGRKGGFSDSRASPTSLSLSL